MKFYCSYQGCNNIRDTFSSITFFQIPKFEDPRREIWIKNSGNPDLRSLKNTSKCFFCENHFEKKMIRKQFDRTTLNKFAVPIKCDEACAEPDDTARTDDRTGSPKCKINVDNNKSKVELHITNGIEQQELENYDADDEEIIKSNLLNQNENEYEPNLSNLPSKQIKRKLRDSSTNNNKIRLLTDNEDEDAANVKTILAGNYQIINDFNIDDESLSSAICFELHKNDEVVELSKRISNDVSIEELNPETSFSFKIIPVDSALKIDENVVIDGERNNNSILRKITQEVCICKETEKESDKYFLLSLLDNFQRLPYPKKSIAKIKILQYLNSLENTN